MTREEAWENRILQLLEALPFGDDGRKRVPVMVCLQAINAIPVRANQKAIARILKAQHYTRTSFRTSIGVIAGYISPVLVMPQRGKSAARRRRRKTSSL